MEINVIWRSDPVVNPVGTEARIVEIDGEKTLEMVFAKGLSFSQKMKAIWSILTGKEYIINSIYGEMPK